MNKLTLKAETRTQLGRKVKQLRSVGKVPGNIFGRNFKSHSITVDLKELESIFAKAGETGLVEIEVGNEKKPVLIHNFQKDPVSNMLQHVDFLQVDLKQKVSAMVPVVLIGESPAEKLSLGTVIDYITEVEVEALPEDLPDKFELDISVLTDVDSSLQIKDIKVDPKKVEIKKELEEIIVKVEPQKEEKVEETPVVEVGTEGETTETEEGKTPESDSSTKE